MFFYMKWSHCQIKKPYHFTTHHSHCVYKHHKVALINNPSSLHKLSNSKQTHIEMSALNSAFLLAFLIGSC